MVDRELREIIRFHQGEGGALDAALHAQCAQQVTDQRGLPGPQVAPQGDDKRLSLKVLRGQCLGQGLGLAAGLPFVGQPVSLQFFFCIVSVSIVFRMMYLVPYIFA